MKYFLKVSLAFLAIILCALIYLNTNFYIRRQVWKYRDGVHIGDWVKFNRGPIKLKGIEIYLEDEEVARISFCLGKLLVIRSISSGESGYYINK